MSSRLTALFAIVLASLLWSTAGVVTKILLKTFDPLPLAFLRFFIASLVIAPFFIKNVSKSIKQNLKLLVLISLFGSGNIAFFYFGVAKTTANATAIIYTALPLVIALLSYLLIHERITKRKLSGILLGCIGIFTIILLPLWETGKVISGNTQGNLLIFVAVLSWSLYTVGSRYLISQKQLTPFSMTAISIFTSAIIFFLLTTLTSHRNYIEPLFKLNNLLLVMHLAVLVTVATYLLFQWAIKHSSATTASLTNYLQPVFGIILNMLFLGEQLTWGFIIGSILVFGGVIWATGTQVFDELYRFVKPTARLKK